MEVIDGPQSVVWDEAENRIHAQKSCCAGCSASCERSFCRNILPLGETGYDRVLGFTLPGRNARGRVVRLGPCSTRALGPRLSAARSATCWPKRWC
jgi:hypothetical protein